MKKYFLIFGLFIGCKAAAPKKYDSYQDTAKVIQMIVPARAYQLEIVEDSLLLFDGNRFVGAIPFEDSTAIGSMIIGDNE